MSASLHDLLRRFAASLTGPTCEPGLAVYRNTVTMNCRAALGATYPVVRELTGTTFFNAAVDAFAAACPSTGGDLNVYGGEFANFLAAYPHAQDMPYLPDVARLEWAIDEAARAADLASSSESLLAALARVPGDAVAHQRFLLDPSCRLVRSAFPVMRIWQVHRVEGERGVDLDAGSDHLLVRREAFVPSVTRLAPADFAFLAALDGGGDLASALEAALAVDGGFDLAATLGAFIRDGCLAALA